MAITIESRDSLPSNKDIGSKPTINKLGVVSPEEEALLGLYTYSGADIKLVVHLPPNEEAQESAELIQMREELEELERQLERTPQNDQSSSISGRIATLRQTADNQFQLLILTPQDDPNYDLIEQDINNINAEIDTLEETYNNAVNSNSRREELSSRIQALSSQIEEEQDYAATRSVTKTLAEITTLSLSIHRDKRQVRTLGSTYLRSVTRGPRTISGSMVWTVFHAHIMDEFLHATHYRSTGVGDWDRFRYTSAIMDQIPPLDISITFANEYGNLSYMSILGVEFMNEGMVMSIEDLHMEGTAQYIARDYDPMRAVGNRILHRNKGAGQEITGTSVMMDDLRRRIALRNNPWI